MQKLYGRSSFMMELSSVREREYDPCFRDRQAITQEPESVDVWSHEKLVDVERSLAQAECLHVMNVTPTVDFFARKRGSSVETNN